MVTYKDRTVVGLTEDVILHHDGRHDKVRARIDTGAERSSVDINLASKLKLGPVVASRVVKSANGSKLRPIVKLEVELCGRRVTETFSLSDRSHMRYKVLIGQNILKKGFLIDPSKGASHG
ncbi:hypothetical protein D6789_01915 [Candidatus Woesearchaeota archaeon]|nr:MAG: hypothetical protein D6789_01915 [Candidatus Woesearchaeota archaeon]